MSIHQAGADIIMLQVGIVFQYGFYKFSLRQKADDQFNRNPHISDNGFAVKYL